MRSKGIRSWMAAAALALTLALESPALADSQATIIGDGVRFRSGPGTSYSAIGAFYQGDAVTVTGQSGDWYAVTSNGSNGYVYRSYVRVGSSGTSQSGGASATATLKRGSTGDKVKQLQGNLIYLGYLNGRADGSFGANTEAAVKQYQRRNGLSADGKAGTLTNRAIQQEVLRMVNVIETAKKYLGTAYVTGGASPSTGFDCSGLTQYAFGQAGMSIPRVSTDQAKAGTAVPVSQMRPGDLVAFNSPVSHVGVYLGGGKFIHSPKSGDVVKITELKYMNLTAVRRFTGVLAG